MGLYLSYNRQNVVKTKNLAPSTLPKKSVETLFLFIYYFFSYTTQPKLTYTRKLVYNS